MMKKILMVALAVMCLLVSGCRKEKVYKIAVSQCSQDDWRAKMNDEILRQAMMFDNIEVEIRSADDSSARQIEDLEYFRENGFDIILVAPNEAAPLAPIISEIHHSGIPVVVFDRDVDTRDYSAFQGADNYGIGHSAAEYAAALTASKGKVIEIQGLPASTPARMRNLGFVNTLDSLYPRMQIVASAIGNWNDEQAFRATDSLLSLYPDIDLIYAHNDRMAIAAREAADRHGIRPYIIGVDAAPSIGIRAVAD